MSTNSKIKAGSLNPFGELIGLKFTKCEKGYSQCTLEINQRLMNPFKSLHGGVMYSMIDTGMGIALYNSLADDEYCATIEIQISYFSPVTFGTLTCESNLICRKGSIGFLEAKIKDNENLIASASGTFSIIKNKKDLS